jgi:hypothetical protein
MSTAVEARLIGPGGADKSTIGALLAESLEAPSSTSIGTSLAESELTVSTSADTDITLTALCSGVRHAHESVNLADPPNYRSGRVSSAKYVYTIGITSCQSAWQSRGLQFGCISVPE